MSSDHEFFAEHGYFLAKSIYSTRMLDAMERDFDRIVRQLVASGEQINARWENPELGKLDGGASEVLHTHSVQRYSSVWLQAIMDGAFLDCAEQFLGPNIILHHTKLFQKPPRHGSPFPAHQDWSYFPTRMNKMIAGIVFLQDTDDEMGGLRVYPGSHKLGRLGDSSGLTPSSSLEKYPIENATPVDAARGDVLFFHCCTLHGSLPNRSNKVRKTVLVQMHSGEDCLEDPDSVKHRYDALTLRGWNFHMTRNHA